MFTKPFLAINRLAQFAILFSILFLAACTDLVQDEFEPYGPFPCVNGFLHADSVISIRVSLMKELGDEPLPLVENALVLLLKNEAIIDTLRFTDGKYYSTRVAQANSSYQVKVKIAGLDTASATCHVPPKPIVNHIEHINVAGINYELYPYPAVDIDFAVYPNNTSYYEVLLRNANDGDWFCQNILTDPVLLAEGYVEYYDNYSIVFSSRYISETSLVVRVNYDEQGGTNEFIYRAPLVVYFREVSEEYYLFRKSLYFYKESLYPELNLSGYNVQSLYSNIEGGIGILAGASTFMSDTLYPTNVMIGAKK